MKAGQQARSNPTAGIPRIAGVAISTTSTEPLRGIVTIDAAGSVVEFELDAEIAHGICTRLERFLTQAREQKSRLCFDP